MSRTSKEYCRVTILMLLTISLIIPPVASGANGGPGFAVEKAQAALRTKITGAWVDESIDKVLMDLADQADVDIVKSPEVTGNVTAKITAVPLAEVLTNILAAHGFTYVATENMIRVTAISEITRAKEELISKVYHITYADANDVAGSLARFVSDKGSVAFNKGTSHIVVTDTEQRMKAVDNFVARVDRQTQQVLVEVKIYEITTREGFDLGSALYAARNTPVKTIERNKVTPDSGDMLYPTGMTETYVPTQTTTQFRDEAPHYWGETTNRSSTTPATTSSNFFEVVQYTDPTGADRTDTTTADPVTKTETTYEQLMPSYTRESYTEYRRKPWVGGSFDRERGGTLSFSLLNDAVDLEFALNVLKKEVESKLLANPRILVVDNETANFEIVREVPYRELEQVGRADPITYTDFKNVGVLLKVTPHIARGGLVRLRIAPEFSILVSQDAYGVPTIDARRADTVALIKDGQTIAIGGLRKRETSKEIAKVPLLGDIPLLGNLFKSSSESVEINELVVLITPRIIDNLEPTPAVLSEDGENGTPQAFRGDKEFAKPQAQVIGKPKAGKPKAGKPKPQDGAVVKVLESSGKAPQPVERSPQTTLEVAYGYLKTGRFDLAKETLTSVIAAQPNNSTAHQYLGYCHLKSGDIKAAVQSYLTAVDLNNADFEAHRGLGVAYMLKARSDGDPNLADRAVEQWQVSLDINPDQANAPALRKMIEAYMR